MGEAAVTLVARVNLNEAPAQLKALKDQILEVGEASLTAGEQQAIAAARTATQLDRLISRHNAEAQALENLKTKVEGTTDEYGRLTDRVAAWLAGDADEKTEQWAASIDRVAEAATGATGAFGRFGASLVGEGGIVAGGLLAAQAIGQLVNIMHESVVSGAEEQAKLVGMDLTMQGLGRSVSRANDLVHEFSGQFATEGSIANAVTNLSVMNLTWSQQRDIIDATTKLAIDRSEDVNTALSGVTQALETGETRELKRMGIVVDSAQAEKDYAHALGITGRALDDQEKHYAIADAALQKMSELVQNATGSHDTLQNTLNQEKVAWDNLTESIGAGEGALGHAASAWSTFMTRFWMLLTPPDDEARRTLDAIQRGPGGSEHLNLPSLSGNQGAFNADLGPKAFDAHQAHIRHEQAAGRAHTRAVEEAEKHRADAEAAHTRTLHHRETAGHAYGHGHRAAHHIAADHEAHILEQTEKHWMALGARQALDDIAKTTFSEDLVGGGKYARLMASKTALGTVQGQVDEAHRTMGPMTLRERQAYDTALGELPRLRQNYDKQHASWQIGRAAEGRKLAEESAKAEADAVANVQDRAMAEEQARYSKEQADIRANYGNDAQLLAEAYTVHQQELTKIQQDESLKRVQLVDDEVAKQEKTIGQLARMIAHPNAGALAAMPFQTLGGAFGMAGAVFTGAISLLDEASKRQLEAADLQLRAAGNSITASAQDAINVSNAKENLQTVSTWQPIVGVIAELGTIAGDIGKVVEMGVENIGAGVGNLVADIGIGIANVALGIGDAIHNAFDDVFGGGKHQVHDQIAYNPFKASDMSQMPNIIGDATSAWQTFVTSPEAKAQGALNEANAASPLQQAALQAAEQGHLLDLARQYGQNSIQYKETQIQYQDESSTAQNVQQLVGNLYGGAGGTNAAWGTALSDEAKYLEGLTPAQLASANAGQIAGQLNQQNPGANFTSADIQTLVQTIANGQGQLSQDIKNLLMNGSSVNKPLYAQVINFHDLWTSMPAGVFFRASTPVGSVNVASGSNITPGAGNLGSMNPARTVGS